MLTIYHMLKLTVTATDHEVRAAINAKWAGKWKPNTTAKQREAFKQAILREHHAAQRLYTYVTGSM